MDVIYIPQLKKAPNQTEVVHFKEFLPGIETLTPVQGHLSVTHQGSYLEVSAQAETIITLTCNRCLQQYNHRLGSEAAELIWFDETAEADTGPLEREVALEDLVETLPPQGYFDLGTWLYEQLCLAIPQRQLCDQQCSGILLQGEQLAPTVTTDRRWAALEALKKNLSS